MIDAQAAEATVQVAWLYGATVRAWQVPRYTVNRKRMARGRQSAAASGVCIAGEICVHLALHLWAITCCVWRSSVLLKECESDSR
jgi:hypothetical protein